MTEPTVSQGGSATSSGYDRGFQLPECAVREERSGKGHSLPRPFPAERRRASRKDFRVARRSAISASALPIRRSPARMTRSTKRSRRSSRLSARSIRFSAWAKRWPCYGLAGRLFPFGNLNQNSWLGVKWAIRAGNTSNPRPRHVPRRNTVTVCQRPLEVLNSTETPSFCFSSSASREPSLLRCNLIWL